MKKTIFLMVMMSSSVILSSDNFQLRRRDAIVVTFQGVVPTGTIPSEHERVIRAEVKKLFQDVQLKDMEHVSTLRDQVLNFVIKNYAEINLDLSPYHWYVYVCVQRELFPF